MLKYHIQNKHKIKLNISSQMFTQNKLTITVVSRYYDNNMQSLIITVSNYQCQTSTCNTMFHSTDSRLPDNSACVLIYFSQCDTQCLDLILHLSIQ